MFHANLVESIMSYIYIYDIYGCYIAKRNGFTGGFVHGQKIANSSCRMETWKKKFNHKHAQKQTQNLPKMMEQICLP